MAHQATCQLKYLTYSNLSGCLALERGATSYANHHYMLVDAEKLRALVSRRPTHRDTTMIAFLSSFRAPDQANPDFDNTLIACALKKSVNELQLAKEVLRTSFFIRLNKYMVSGEDEKSLEPCTLFNLLRRFSSCCLSTLLPLAAYQRPGSLVASAIPFDEENPSEVFERNRDPDTTGVLSEANQTQHFPSVPQDEVGYSTLLGLVESAASGTD